MGVATYSPKKLVNSVAGETITGFSDSDIVTITLDEPKFVKYTSVDGTTSRSHNVSDSGRFVYTLNQTSAANQIFSGLLKADLANPDGSATFGLGVRDNNTSGTGTYFLGTGAWVEGMPESGYAKEIGTREWVIEASNIEWNISGNESSDVVNALSTAATVAEFLA
ncbi:MAG: DUF3277 family protein [Pseudomonadales bacterium]|nr:DUF3277 family protein [Pseudomonadales bacterium]